jgi:hypothetical protein
MADNKERSDAAAVETQVPEHEVELRKDTINNRRWVNYLWDTFDKSPEERRFLFKLDAILLTFASLGEWPTSRVFFSTPYLTI